MPLRNDLQVFWLRFTYNSSSVESRPHPLSHSGMIRRVMDEGTAVRVFVLSATGRGVCHG